MNLMEKGRTAQVAIVVLNWNGWEDTIECLSSLIRMDYPNYQIILVDNASTNDSINKIKEWADNKLFPYVEYSRKSASEGRSQEREKEAYKALPNHIPHPLILIRNEHNLGFAVANNIGIKFALLDEENEFIMALNNDTTVKPDFLKAMLKAFSEFPDAGMAGPKILDYNTAEHWQGAVINRVGMAGTIMFFTPLKALFGRSPLAKIHVRLLPEKGYVKTYGIAGCCMLFKRSVIEQIGLFDESTFLGWEEYIIAEKLMKAGYATYAVADSIIYHKMAKDTLRIEPVEKTMIFLKSERYFQEKYLNMPSYQRMIIKIVRLVSFAIVVLFNPAYRKNSRRLFNAILEKPNRD